MNDTRDTMKIELPEPFQEIVRKAVASGAFNSPEEVVCHALTLLERKLSGTAPDLWFPDDLDPDFVAASQNIGPIQNPDEGAAESWPETESFEDWLSELRELRGHGSRRDVQNP